MLRINLVLILFSLTFGSVPAQEPFQWTVTKEGIFRDGESFFINGQSWSKKTEFTYKKGINAELEVKQIITELHEIGVNVIRLYGSPDESDWDGSSNYHNLIRWIEEWNVANPDMGDPNQAMHYLVQISPKDPQSPLPGDLPQNSEGSFYRAIIDSNNPGSVASIISTVDNITAGSRFLLGYLVYHELNVSSKYISWYNSVGASGIEQFINSVADSIHYQLAPGKLVSHTGDSKEPEQDIYEIIEALDQTEGNVFANLDLIGFNLYISTNSLLEENSYYRRIVNRRLLSVNENRGWFIGETGASTDREADPSSIAAANYTNLQGAANLQLMWNRAKRLGNMLGFVLFTVQDNDKQEMINLNAAKQRGFYDYYGDQKYLYCIYSDIINEISTNHRYHYEDSHGLEMIINDEIEKYTIEFRCINSTESDVQFHYSIFGDDGGSSNQRFSVEIKNAYHTIKPGEEKVFTELVPKPSGDNMFSVSATFIKEFTPVNQYFWGREHLYLDAISTIAGLNLYTETLPERPLSARSASKNHDRNIIRGILLIGGNQVLNVPAGNWNLTIYSLNGSKILTRTINSDEYLLLDSLFPDRMTEVVIYKLERLNPYQKFK